MFLYLYTFYFYTYLQLSVAKDTTLPTPLVDLFRVSLCGFSRITQYNE